MARRSSTKATTKRSWGTAAKAAYKWVGTKTWCPDCRQMIPSRDWASHTEGHTIVEGTARERWRNRNPPSELRQKERRRRAAGGPKPVNPRKRSDRQRKENAQTDKTINDHDQRVARAWDKRQRELEKMAQSKGGTTMNGVCGQLATAARNWGDFVPQTHAELKQHLMGSSGAFMVMANSVRIFCQQGIVGQKLHPAIARPIESVADTLDEERIYFTRAYVIFVRLYQLRIEYEDQGGPKPDDEFWKKG